MTTKNNTFYGQLEENPNSFFMTKAYHSISDLFYGPNHCTGWYPCTGGKGEGGGGGGGGGVGKTILVFLAGLQPCSPQADSV